MSKVPPQWPLKRPTPIAFIGEAPSWEEEHKGAPFVGPSGRLFNSLLRAAGLAREDYLVTNVFNEKLPDNDVGAWCAPMSVARPGGFTNLAPIGDSGFLRPEFRHHLERLRLELEACQPTVIVPLGGTALWALTSATSIGAVRGTVQVATRLVPGVKLLPTYHPSFIMKQFKFYPVVVADLQRAAKEASLGRSIILPTRTLILEPTLAEVRDSIPKLLASPLLSVDIETAWGQITCIGFSPDPTYGICIPFVDRRNVSRSYWETPEDEAAAWGMVRHILASSTPKLGQNFGGYDLYWLLEKYRCNVRNLSEDTRLLHHALNPELPKSLEFMQAHSTQGAWKHMGKHKQKAKKDD